MITMKDDRTYYTADIYRFETREEGSASFDAGFLHEMALKPEQAIKYRKAVMFLIAQHFGRMGAVVKGKSPYDKQTFKENAALVDTLSRQPWEAFMVQGTDKGDTTMSVKVYTQKSEFKAAADLFGKNTTQLVRAAEGGDLGAIKSQFGKVAANCKRCHKEFRVR